jgi:TatD DNase family protein
MVDSHTHLHLCKAPEAEVVAAAREAGITRIVTVGTDAETNRAALSAAERYPDVYAAIGIHPNSATGFGDAELSDLASLAGHERCVAIGETGLDYYRDWAPADDQRRAFRAQISLARRLGKPVVIHTRSADDETIATLAAEADGVKVILHCFSMPDRVEECLSHPDWWLSFAGPVTYPSAGDLRAAMLRVPLGRLLVETDAPYLSPQPFRGKPNEPAYTAHTARGIAEERRIGYDELDTAVDAAAAEVFGW